jgi:hypothetical protein
VAVGVAGKAAATACEVVAVAVAVDSEDAAALSVAPGALDGAAGGRAGSWSGSCWGWQRDLWPTQEGGGLALGALHGQQIQHSASMRRVYLLLGNGGLPRVAVDAMTRAGLARGPWRHTSSVTVLVVLNDIVHLNERERGLT